MGTRFRPATKAMPKEMLTVVDEPLIQYAVEEVLEAGIEQIIFVTGRGKSLDAIAGIRMAPGSSVYVRQQEPLGLGHAIWCAREIVGDEPFAVLLPDELMVGTPGFLSQMVTAYKTVGGNLVGTRGKRILEHQQAGTGGEVQLTDAMARLIGNQPFCDVTFDGERYDCGDKAGYIQATFALALARNDIGPAVRAFALDRLGN